MKVRLGVLNHGGAIAVAALLATGCAGANRIALKDADRQRVRTSKTLALVEQQEINVGVAPATGGAAFGLIGAIVDSSINSSRAKSAEAVVVPVRNALVDYDARATLAAALTKALASAAWLKGNTVELGQVKAAQEDMFGAVKVAGTDVVLFVRLRYQLTPSLDALTFSSRVSLLPPAPTPQAPVKKDPTVAELPSWPPAYYTNAIEVSVRLPGFEAGKTTVEEATQRWAEENGAKARRALDGGMAELAEMIAYDLEKAGPQGTYEPPAGANTMKVPNFLGNGEVQGYVEKTANGRTWVRLGSGTLLSVGQIYQ